MFSISNSKSNKVRYITCIQPRPPWGIGAPCWLTTSKKMAVLVEGVSAQNFHATVPPMPISTSLTVASFRFADTQEPMALQAKQLKNIKSRLY
jgi:hypothetical protein